MIQLLPPTAARIRRLFDYDPETGWLIRRVRVAQRIQVGDIAGTPDGSGYLRICVDGTDYRAHRLVWLHVYGVWPLYEVDHINGIRDDNRLCNLRLATRGENSQNRHNQKQANNKSGVLGVCWSTREGKWVASLNLRRRKVHCSYHKRFEDAVAARAKAKEKYHAF